MRQDNWKLGIDNRSPDARIAAGAVRDAVNFSPTDAGTFALRPGYQTVYSGGKIRGAARAGKGLALVADGGSLVELDLRSRVFRTVAPITQAGPVCFAELNEEIFIATAQDMLRYKDGQARQWIVPKAPDSFAISQVGGALQPGLYRLACTFVDDRGDESAVSSPMIVSLPAGKSLFIEVPEPPSGLSVRLYSSAANGETLYLQTSEPGAYAMTVVSDAGARCVTLGLESMIRPDALCQVGARLVAQRGKLVVLSRPYRQHLYDPVTDFYQFESVPTVVLPCGSGLFVCTGSNSHFIQGAGSETPSKPVILKYGAVAGTGRVLPDGRVAWMSAYGVVVGNADGSASPISSQLFVPREGEHGASGVVNSNGSSLLLTTMRGDAGQSPLAARDYFDAEVIGP